MRSRAAAALCLVGALVLTGCAGIPSSGPVHQAGTVVDERDDPFTRIIASGPVPNMKPTDLVAGFLRASASFDDNHAVARQYLTSDRARDWNADDGATVYYSDTSQGGSVGYEQPKGTDTVLVSLLRAAVLSPQGSLTGDASGTKTTVEFRVTKVAGQWRISALPSGLLLTTNDVGRAYRPYDIYFPNPARTVVVPDQILVPVGPGASTSLVRALLAGPTPWLAQAVLSAIPAGTKLVVDSVPINGGVAQVDLTAPAASVGRLEAQAMSAQFAWTLRQLSGVTTMRLTVNGVPLRVPSVGDAQNILAWSSFDPDGGADDADAYAVAKGKAVIDHDGKLQAVRGPLGDGSTVVSQVVPSFDGTQLAALDQDRHRLLVSTLTAGAKAQVVLQANALSPPSWDRLGDVWVVDRSAGTGAVYEIPPGGRAQLVAVTGLPKTGTLSVLRLARDGVRVAALVNDANGVGQVYLGRVERSQSKVALAGFRLVSTGFVKTVDLAWATADRLAVLGQSKATDGMQPWLVDLNGTVEQGLGPATDGSAMVSVGAAPTQTVLTSTADGTLLFYTGFGWDSSLGQGAFPSYPG
jgi:Lipoprotein LpqB beta-propeller domain/Sporulation and spore germination